MPSIFHGLNSGYTGLKAARLGIDTAGHNITNAETEGYTRQRVVQQTSTPLHVTPGDVGSGTVINQIVRIHDEFVYKRYKESTQDKEESDFLRKQLEELSSLFPDIDNVGLKNDLFNYQNAWSSLAEQPDKTAQKVVLAQTTITLVRNITDTRQRVEEFQDNLDHQVEIIVNDINSIGERIAEINKIVREVEQTEGNNANDLLDERGRLELTLSKLIGNTVAKQNLSTDAYNSTSINDTAGMFNININGYSFVDGVSFHPLVVERGEFRNGMREIYYERQDGQKFSIMNEISGGKLGAVLQLRGNRLDEDTGQATTGYYQEVLNDLDTFAGKLIQVTNNIYAESASERLQSNKMTTVTATTPLMSRDDLSINAGSFDAIVYDGDGNEVARKTITIDPTTQFGDDSTSGSIVWQFRQDTDDNEDNNMTNDFEDYYTAKFIDGDFVLEKESSVENATFTVAIEDNGTNFAGAIGLNRFFDGDDAETISLNSDLAYNSSLIAANKSPVAGNNEVANKMLQAQYDDQDFEVGQFITKTDTFSGYLDSIVTGIATKTEEARTKDDTFQAQLETIQLSYEATSKVDIDEELISLTKYQTAYSAAAKVITTIDQVLETLLGIKR
jgi:flagellar hook-associated protein 1 FlgK